MLANSGSPCTVYPTGSFENEALENEDQSTKHPNLKNEAPKTRKRSTQILKPLYVEEQQL